jgi:hypothetical protein
MEEAGPYAGLNRLSFSFSRATLADKIGENLQRETFIIYGNGCPKNTDLLYGITQSVYFNF